MNRDSGVTVNVIRGSVVGVRLFFICSLTFCTIFSHKIPKNYNLSTFHALLELFFVCKWIHNHFLMWSPWCSQIIFAIRNCSAWQRNNLAGTFSPGKQEWIPTGLSCCVKALNPFSFLNSGVWFWSQTVVLFIFCIHLLLVSLCVSLTGASTPDGVFSVSPVQPMVRPLWQWPNGFPVWRGPLTRLPHMGPPMIALCASTLVLSRRFLVFDFMFLTLVKHFALHSTHKGSYINKSSQSLYPWPLEVVQSEQQWHTILFYFIFFTQLTNAGKWQQHSHTGGNGSWWSPSNKNLKTLCRGLKFFTHPSWQKEENCQMRRNEGAQCWTSGGNLLRVASKSSWWRSIISASEPTISSLSRCSQTEASQAGWKTACLRTSWPIKKGGSLSRADLQNHPPQPAGRSQQILKQACLPGHSLSFPFRLMLPGNCFYPQAIFPLVSEPWTGLFMYHNNCMWQIKLIFIYKSLYGQLIAKD